MVALVRMKPDEYEEYLVHLVEDYAAEHVKSGRWQADNAVDKAQEQVNQLLPDGPRTENQYLYSIRNEDDEKVGILWFGEHEQDGKRAGFIFDIAIDEAHRRYGYGTQALQQLENIAADMGLESIELHVFGHNEAARDMYQKLGYIETNIMMRKDLQ